MASLLHLLLPDFDQPGWWAPRILEAIGAAWLLWRPSRWGFALCFLSTAWPLLFLRDVLTQSAYLTVCAALGVVGARGTRAAVVWLTAGTYVLAVFHKLNTGFFDPTYSCADHAWAQVMLRWPVPDLAPLSPWAALAIELAMATALIRRSPWRWPLGLLFHLPMTVTLAPAFGAVMLSGYVAAGSAREAARWRRVWRTRRGALLVGATAVLAFDLWAGRTFAPVIAFEAAAAGALAVGALLAWTPRRRGATPRWAYAVFALWIAHGLTPYAGWQFQHSAAMLSNLRIDRGCHNHLLMPESLRGVDPYIRIDEAHIGGRAKRERLVRETLWNVAALHAMRRNWCIPENRPIRFVGTWRERAFEIPDLCASDWIEALPGAERRLPGLQLFQKNLRRDCPAACVH